MFIARANSQGLIDDADRTELRARMPGVRRLFVFSHGWMTSDSDEAAHLSDIELNLLPKFSALPTLAVAIRWPSRPFDCELLDLATFYRCADLANLVGANAGRDVIEAALENADGPLEVIPMGHSFGCRVCCEAVASVTDKFSSSPKLVLIQAAFPSDWLDPGKEFGGLAFGPQLLVTTSAEDLALKDLFPLAEPGAVALGYGGPTGATQKEYGGTLQTVDILPWQRLHFPQQTLLPLDRHTEWNMPELFEEIAGFVNED